MPVTVVYTINIFLEQKIGLMHFIKNSSIVEDACRQFIEPHPCLYNFHAELSPLLPPYPQLKLEHQDINTTVSLGRKKTSNEVRLHFVKNLKNKDNCIIYLHGLSSYCMEGKFLLPLLGDNLNLCLFDSRAHGKNKSQFVTYGLLESQQLEQVIASVVAKGFQNIILWGRSMGAVTALRFLQQHNHKSITQHVKYVIADAPFSSFTDIATDIVSRVTHLPAFLSLALADTFANKIKQKYQIELREINLDKLSTHVPVYFLYSSNDQLMGEKHISSILKSFKGDCQTKDIKVGHNDQRPQWVINNLIARIGQVLKKKITINHYYVPKKRGLSITRFTSSTRMSHSGIGLSPCTSNNNRTANHLKISLKQQRQVPKTIRPQKENLQYGKFIFKGELGGSKVSKTADSGSSRKERKITVSQFFIGDY